MGGTRQSALRRYGAGILAAFLVTLVLKVPAVSAGAGTPILVFFFAILLAAWYGGLGPGLFVLTTISILAGNRMNSSAAVVRLGLFVGCGATIVWLIEALHAARRRVEAGAADVLSSETRLRQLIESMTDHAIFTTDEGGLVTSWSPSAERILGYRDAEVLGRGAWFVLPASPGANGLVPQSGPAPLGSGHFEGDLWCVRKDGSTFCMSTSVTPLLRDDRPGSTWVLRDITERNRAEEELRAAKESAEAASRTKDQFLAALSHELRTPLTPALVSVTALVEDPDTPKAIRPGLEIIRRNIGLEARLIDDLLDVTRISQGKLRLRREVADAHELILRAVEICRDEIATASLELTIDLHAPEHWIDVDPARFQQIAWNLVKNAVKFTPRPGRIVIRSSNRAGGDGPAAERPRLVVEVSDTGIGIDPLAMGSIFRAFEQGSPAHSQQFGGLGLGLAISRTLAEVHGGRLSAASAGRGRGATFTLELPTVAAVPATDHVPLTRIPTLPVGALRILLVEDNGDTLRVLSRLLRTRGYHVATADRMAVALAEARREPFDLLVSDIGLPDGSGLELMRTLRAERPVPGIALSGFGMEEDLRKSREAGFATHLTKPVDFPALEEAIRRLVGQVEPSGSASPIPFGRRPG